MAENHNKRIARNTVMLYIRMFISMGISIFTSRIVLHQLGVDDYGVYNVLGGIVALISFLNSAMTGATTRFLTYEQENRDPSVLRKTFGSSFIIHLLIAGLVGLLLETVGLWFVNHHINLPSSVLPQAIWVYQFAIFSTLINIIKVPYMAALIAHEKMGVYAVVEILNSVLHLVIALLLGVFLSEKLFAYSGMTFICSILIFLLYAFYCMNKFTECSSKIKVEKRLFKPMFKFFGWDLYGNLSNVARGQGVNILLNMFFGVVANTAYGISNQVQSAVGSFSSNIITAVKPQIIKTYAAGNFDRCSGLIITASKIIFVLLLLISVPLIIEMKFILELWLDEVPKYSVWFARFTVGFLFFAALSTVLVTGVHATGDIRRPSFINGTIYLSVLPITYFAFKVGLSIYFPLILNIVFVLVGCIVNLVTLNKTLSQLSLRHYLIDVLCPCFFLAILALGIGYGISLNVHDEILRVLFVCVGTTITILLSSYLIVAKGNEKVLVKSYLKSVFKKWGLRKI